MPTKACHREFYDALVLEVHLKVFYNYLEEADIALMHTPTIY